MVKAAGPHLNSVSSYKSHYLVACRRGYAAAFVRSDLKRSNRVVNLQQRGKVVDGNGHQLLDSRRQQCGDLQAVTFFTPLNMLPLDLSVDSQMKYSPTWKDGMVSNTHGAHPLWLH